MANPIYVGDVKVIHAEFQDDNNVPRNCTVIEGGVSDSAILNIQTVPMDPTAAASFVDLTVEMKAEGIADLLVSATNSLGVVISGNLSLEVLPKIPTELPATKVVFTPV